MRILGIGEANELGDMYLRLQRAGHDVRVFISEEASGEVMSGMLERSADWQTDLDWVRSAGPDGFIVFETATYGEAAAGLRRDGFQVIGGSPLGDRLEGDRAYGQRVMREVGMQTTRTHEFDGADGAKRFIRDNPRRFVLKVNGANEPAWSRTFVGEADDGEDVIAMLSMLQRRKEPAAPPDFVLMEHLTGVEVGVGAYFNGEAFLEPVCLDWEHKRFFPGDLGELTGEMGTLVTYRNADRLFRATLARMQPLLRADGYCGYINLNTIINDKGIWPLEFTCRFGYPGFAILSALHEDAWDVILARMCTRESLSFGTRDGYAIGVVLTVPPFPYPYGYSQLSKGAPISFRHGLRESDAGVHPGEVARRDGQLVTDGTNGYVMVVSGTGESAEAARASAYARVDKVVMPNMRYRRDIGERFIERDRLALAALGYLG